MRLRPTIVEAVLVAFFATTAVPGPGIVAHTHAGGDHEHAHDFLAFAPHHHDDEDDHDADHDHHDHADHDHDHRHHHAHHAYDDHALDLTEPEHDPLHHTHVSSPFQRATRPAPPAVLAALRTSAVPAQALPTPPTQRPARVRSRGPPPFASV